MDYKAQTPITGIVHSPTDIAHATTQWAKRWSTETTLGYEFGVDVVDKDMLPFRPGRQTIIVARPGHGKTTLLSYITVRICKDIVDRELTSRAVIAFTWEQYVEELAATIAAVPGATLGEIEKGQANEHAINSMGVRLMRMPLWIIGYSFELQNYIIKSPSGAAKTLPKLTPEIAMASIDWIYQEYGIQPAAMTFDYLQEMSMPGEYDKREQVAAAAHVSKEMALRYEAPSILASQARREVDDYKFKMPQLGDSQWSSTAEQVSDTVLGAWMPYVSVGMGQIDIHGTKYTITPNMLILRMNKQRGGIPRATWPLHINHETLVFSEYTDIDEVY